MRGELEARTSDLANTRAQLEATKVDLGKQIQSLQVGWLMVVLFCVGGSVSRAAWVTLGEGDSPTRPMIPLH